MKQAQKSLRGFGVVAMVALTLIVPRRAALGQCTQWEAASEVGPPERHYAAMAYDSRRGVVVLFGGRACCPFSYYGDTWEWDGTTWTQVATGGPGARAWHRMAYDSRRGVTVLFGGSPDDDGTWEWDGVQWTLVATGGPPGGSGSAMAYDAARGECVLFTGAWWSTEETWTWNGDSWRLATREGPSRRLNAAMTYDAARERVVFSGGSLTQKPIDETWEWDGSSWTLVNTRGVPPRASHSLVYDPVRGITLMMGGFVEGNGSNRSEETWQWDGAGWSLLSETLDGSNAEPDAFAMDVQRGEVVSYGGWGTGTRTLTSAPELWFRRNPATVVHDVGERAELAAVADGIGELSYQWYFGSRRLTDFGPFSGTRTATLIVDPVLPETAGAYTLTVTTSCGSITSATAHLIVVNPQITVYNDCFASNQVAVVWKETTPRGRVHLLYARQPGSGNVPPRRPCGGTPLGLDLATTMLVYSGTSDFSGEGLLHRTIDPSACGGYLQMIEETTCRTSNVAPID